MEGVAIKALPAYNTTGRSPSGEFFHPRGVGNGYLMDFDGFRVYVAGDTEFIPEMSACRGVDVAFLPENLPYTMSDGCSSRQPIHFPRCSIPTIISEVDIDSLRRALPRIEVRL